MRYFKFKDSAELPVSKKYLIPTSRWLVFSRDYKNRGKIIDIKHCWKSTQLRYIIIMYKYKSTKLKMS